jgi:hypothetical protein
MFRGRFPVWRLEREGEGYGRRLDAYKDCKFFFFFLVLIFNLDAVVFADVTDINR